MKKTTIILGSFVFIGLLAHCYLVGVNDHMDESAQTQRLSKSYFKHKTKTSESPDGAGSYYANKRLSKTHSITPVENYTDAINKKRLFFSNNSNKLAEPWQSLGPQQVGGRTRSLEFNPDNPDIIYAAGVSGGVWKSINGGSEWRAVSDDLENMAVVTLAVVPTSPNTILAGTGEGVYVGRPIVRSRGVVGNGIYRSTDDGENWQALSFTLNNSNFRFVNKIRAANDGTVFAATETGIWRSEDIGDSWQLVLNQSSRIGGCHEIEIQPFSTPNALLVSCGSFHSAAVYQSVDNGITWNSVLEAQHQGRTTIAYAPSNPNRVYALSAQNQYGPYPYGLKGFYRSDDGGAHWDLINDYNDSNVNNRALLSTTDWVFDCFATRNYQHGRLAGGGWYYNLITVDPTNENRVWTGGLDLWRSDDGGENFNLASFWWADKAVNSYIHGDHHLIKYHPNFDSVTETRLYATNDGGIWQSVNSSARLASNNCDQTSSEVAWQPLNNQYGVTQFYHGSMTQDGSMLIGGTQDNGTQMKRGGAEWESIFGGDGAYSAIDPKDPNTVYVSSQYANLARIRWSNGVMTITDITSDFFGRSIFIAPFILDPNNHKRLWLAGMALWRSEDQGDNWNQTSINHYSMNYVDGMTAIAVQPGNSNLVLIGGSDGNIYRHTSALSGTGSTPMPSNRIAQGYISSINFDRNNPNKVAATVSTFGQAHAWLSDDAGVSWYAVGDSGIEALPDLPAHDILIAPHDSSTFYIATDIGVYVSVDSGNSWQPLASGLPNVSVERIIYTRHNLQTELVAFTYGRGVFKTTLTDIPNFAPNPSQSNVSVTANQNAMIQIDLSDYFDDPNGDELMFSSSDLPTGLSLTSAGLVQGSINTLGTYTANVQATDGELGESVQLTITITPLPSSSGGGSLLFSWVVLFMLVRRRH